MQFNNATLKTESKDNDNATAPNYETETKKKE
jgi:hypothetical protein